VQQIKRGGFQRCQTQVHIYTTLKFLALQRAPYLSDISKLRVKLEGRRFDIIEEIQAESQRVLDTVTEKDFQEAFQKWRRRWDRCVHAGGNYFEGDGGR
jgi:hypothetical protein